MTREHTSSPTDPNTGRPYVLCSACGAPTLPKGVKKRPNEYDHASGCPYAAIGAAVYWRDEFSVWRGTVASVQVKDKGVYPVHFVILNDVRSKRHGGRNWMREPGMFGTRQNWRQVDTKEPRR